MPIMFMAIMRNNPKNSIFDRFHDASDAVPNSLITCCVCEKVFTSDETEAMRTAHVEEHLESLTVEDMSSLHAYCCPMCQRSFLKTKMTNDEFTSHVNSHFTITT